MKKLLLSAALPLAAMTMVAEPPTGAVHVLGLNGDTTPSEANIMTVGDRDEDDIDEGIWRWSIPSFEITQETGTINVTVGEQLTLGYDSEGEFNLKNELSTGNSMLYMAAGGPTINYNLPAGDYNITLMYWEDYDGEGTNFWILSAKSNAPIVDEANYYLVGFDGNDEPVAGNRFKREYFEEDGESFYMYSLPKYFIGECPEGFTVYDSTAEAYLGGDAAMGSTEVSDDMPMAFVAAGNAPVASTLTPGYYTVNFAPMGAMNMISFILCEDQTPVDNLEYYLLGANGITEPSEAVKFERIEETYEYTDEETGEVESYTNISYTLKGFEFTSAEDGVIIANADGDVEFGYSSDVAFFLPNDLSDESPFTMLVIYGEPVNVTVTPGKYDITFNVSGTTGGALMFEPSEAQSVEGISVESGKAEYFNLQGVRVATPDKGIYIMRQGGKALKVVK